MNYRRYSFGIPFGALAENLVNSHDVTLDEPEHLRTPTDLAAFLREHDLPVKRLGTAELEAVRKLRAEVRALFAAESQAEALRRVNVLLEGARTRLAAVKDRGGVRIAWSMDQDVDFIGALRSAVAVNVAHLAAEFGVERLRVCGASPCIDVFLDTSKRGEQRFCGPRCATRTRVAAHRARQD